VSDRASRGERADETAALLGPALDIAGFDLVETVTVPDERPAIRQALIESCEKAGLVLTTGGTGVAPRDVTPEATRAVLEIEIPGLAEEMRRRSLEVTDKALGSRAVAGARGQTVVLNLPGRPAGAVECFEFVAGAIPHLVALRRGPVPDASHEPGA
jgi:molybdenum cofactor synthesis domain-containing protein